MRASGNFDTTTLPVVLRELGGLVGASPAPATPPGDPWACRRRPGGPPGRPVSGPGAVAGKPGELDEQAEQERRSTGQESSCKARAHHRPSYRLLAMASVKTNVTELPESRVRVQAEVPAEEVERSLQQAARKLGGQMRVPGFRKGKVPPTVVIRRLGREAVLDEALRSALGAWYVDAIDEAGIAPVGEPDLDVGDLPAQGEPLAFSIEIGVRPGQARHLQRPRGRTPRASGRRRRRRRRTRASA